MTSTGLAATVGMVRGRIRRAMFLVILLLYSVIAYHLCGLLPLLFRCPKVHFSTLNFRMPRDSRFLTKQAFSHYTQHIVVTSMSHLMPKLLAVPVFVFVNGFSIDLLLDLLV